jgi:hypothetical protein
MYSARVDVPSVTMGPVLPLPALMQMVSPASNTMDPSLVSTLVLAGSL